MICPVCNDEVEAAAETPTVTCPRCSSTFAIDQATAADQREGMAPGHLPVSDAAPLDANAAAAGGRPDRWAEYERLGPIAEGGMGVVIKARHRVLDRLVAIKQPHGPLAGSAGARQRFLREARAAARLRHPHICPIHEVGDHGGEPYIVMSYIDGRTLRDWGREEAPSRLDVARMAMKVARAVAYAHQHGVVHRDIKPTNIMVDREDNQPVLMDFGLAKEAGAEQGGHVTRDGQVVGTPAYMAPEQAAGRLDQIGVRTDIYALGVLIYELLTDRPPFLGSSGEILGRVQSEDVPSPRVHNPGIERDLETICLKALARDPEARYRTADELADDLDRFASGLPISARRVSSAERLVRRARRNPVAAAGAIAAIVVALVAAGLGWWALRQHALTARMDAFQTTLDRGPLTPPHLQRLEKRLGRVAAISPDRAERARDRLQAALAGAIRESLETPRLGPEKLALAHARVTTLAVRAPQKAAPLRDALAERLSRWRPVTRVAPPFDGAQGRLGVPVRVVDDALIRTKGGPSRIVTEASTRGPARALAVFADWNEAAELGLILHGREPGGYQFRVATGADGRRQRRSFGAVSPSGRVRLVIERGGRTLAARRIRVRDLGGRAISLRAERDGEKLLFQVNDREPLAFLDPFPRPSRGSFGLLWPDSVALKRFRAADRPLPERASPLQRGNRLFAQADYRRALDAFQRQAATAASARFRREAQFKRGVCLLELERESGAISLLEEVARASGSRWPMMASLRLWLVRLRRNEMAAANRLLDRIEVQYGLREIVSRVPLDLRDPILEAYQPQKVFTHFLFPETSGKLERFARIHELLADSPLTSKGALWSLARGFHAKGRLERGMAAARRAIERFGLHGSFPFQEELAWMQRVRGRPEQARAVLDRALARDPEGREIRRRKRMVRLERARARAALGRWAAAESDVDRVLADEGRSRYGTFAAAWLLKGFFRAREGRRAEAAEAWARGLHDRWQRLRRQRGHEPAPLVPDAGRWLRGMPLLHYSMLASLAGEPPSREKLDLLIRRTIRDFEGGTLLAAAKGLIPVRAELLREMWRSEAARDRARRLAFRREPFPALVRISAAALGVGYVRRGAFASRSRRREELLWRFAGDVIDWIRSAEDPDVGAASREAALGSVVKMGMLWKGVAPTTAWRHLKGQLPTRLLGPLAYCCSHRYRRLGREEQAKRFAALARKHARAGSRLEKLLDRSADGA